MPWRGVTGRAWGREGCNCKRMVLEGFAETVAPEQPEGGGRVRRKDIWGKRALSGGQRGTEAVRGVSRNLS